MYLVALVVEIGQLLAVQAGLLFQQGQILFRADELVLRVAAMDLSVFEAGVLGANLLGQRGVFRLQGAELGPGRQTTGLRQERNRRADDKRKSSGRHDSTPFESLPRMAPRGRTFDERNVARKTLSGGQAVAPAEDRAFAIEGHAQT